ncbi:Hypothetical protein CAP_5370 [Chondromyces apiculatus DSM 436]|uniref:Uncharacterized protein n=1 Tax=Chondromyces apiculatus DSM 436 TaxID=1192034 RepID=A0A017T2X0_9BACT|nr:Hypothetical protein CAP_5370 [Chondromyces apiculatus DSM 436]
MAAAAAAGALASGALPVVAARLLEVAAAEGLAFGVPALEGWA